MNTPRVLIVGAGPAGCRAAATLVAAGLHPTVVDEAPRSGGQIYRRTAVGDGREAEDLYGSEANKARDLHRLFDQLRDRITYLPETSVWGLMPDRGEIVRDNRLAQLDFTHLMLCCGATDRVLPLPGWTLPGVVTLGAAQVSLKAQGCLIGPRIAFVGSGPLLYVVARQYAVAGGEVVGVFDTAALRSKLHLLAGLRHAPTVIGNGVAAVLDLVRMGIKLHFGVAPKHIAGAERVSEFVWTKNGRDHSLACDAVAIGYGLRSETQLADLAGCRFEHDARDRAWRPIRDSLGRTSLPNVYIAGDGAGIAGADAAERAGELAALGLLKDCGIADDAPRIAALEQDLARLSHLRDNLERAFPLPAQWAKSAPDDLVLCRCEGVTAGEIRTIARDFGLSDLNRVKALSRLGMGRCQGRFCGPAAAEILAAATAQPIAEVGRLRAQAPIKPLDFSIGAEMAQS